ncbi:heme/steroid binding protein-like protein [Macrophomina phaseolina]|uniref:Heme/steroid binding protein-like protein n=1 Tax=Macrophomina phaseolina TaxID=35725 RepID=A0ABQ8G919_9PEZI|nr:heme/steroid binding protein-like protein [Macrophomina phaseolina]
MLLGISALLISATFLLYNHPPRTWLQFFHDWSQRGLAAPPKSGDERPAAGAPHEAKSTARDATPSDLAERSTSEADQRKPPVSIQVPQLDEPPSESESTQTTPKASTFPVVPSFSVASSDNQNDDDDDDDDDDDEDDNLPPPSFPALNSAQRASGPAPTSSAPRAPPKLKPLPNSALMPPPPPRLASSPQAPQPQRSSGLMPPPRMPASSLRGGPSSPLPNRGPPSANSSSASNSLGLPMAAPVKTPNPRAKVSLTPGHSPLDWAALVKSGSNLSGVASLQRVTPSQLKLRNGRKDRKTGEVMPAWSAYQGKVYNITPYLPYHPGGEGELRRAAGKDGEKLFNEVHPWVNWDNMLSECVVGILVPEYSAAEGEAQSSLEDMD